ncbi:putative integral membrane protein [Pleurocapsa sp. PCC 7327]|nr:putative integral membrane protein [Pleurocapsa sp. PCC 7327]
MVLVVGKDMKKKKIEFERIIFFSDAVFAIAITLLAFNLKLPENSSHLARTSLSGYLSSISPQFHGYIVSFLVIGFYWVSHHRYFRYIKHYNYILVWLNIGFLMCIAFLPFSTAILNDYSGQRLAVIFYAGSMAFVGLMKALLWWYASSHRRLVASSLSHRLIRSLTYRTLVPPMIFLSSIAIAYLNPFLAEFSWLSILIYFLVLKIRWL